MCSIRNDCRSSETYLCYNYERQGTANIHSQASDWHFQQARSETGEAPRVSLWYKSHVSHVTLTACVKKQWLLLTSNSEGKDSKTDPSKSTYVATWLPQALNPENLHIHLFFLISSSKKQGETRWPSMHPCDDRLLEAEHHSKQCCWIYNKRPRALAEGHRMLRAGKCTQDGWWRLTSKYCVNNGPLWKRVTEDTLALSSALVFISSCYFLMFHGRWAHNSHSFLDLIKGAYVNELHI